MEIKLPQKKRSAVDPYPSAMEKELGGGFNDDDLKSLDTSSTASVLRFKLCGIPLWKRSEKRQKRRTMGIFRKKEKSEDDGGDGNRAGLFGRKKPAPTQNDNPYAQQPAQDPYARTTAYQQARANLADGPQGPPSGLPKGPSPGQSFSTPPPSYPGSPHVGAGYGNQKLGATGGYGGNRYDAGSQSGPTLAPTQPAGRFPSRGAGGYGGLGPAEDDGAKEELFAGAKGRYVQPTQPKSANDSPLSGGTGTNYSGDTGPQAGEYGEQRELTAEELEQQDVKDIKEQTNQVRDQTLDSLNKSLLTADDMLQLSEATLARLGRQGEMLQNTEKNLDIAASQSRVAADRIVELNKYNRSMFVPVGGNPFTRKSRREQDLQDKLARHVKEKEVREETRRNGYSTNSKMERTFQGLTRDQPGVPDPTTTLFVRKSDNNKYLVDDNDSDEESKNIATEKEQAIDERMQQLSTRLGRANKIAVAMNEVVEDQNQRIIPGLAEKTDHTDNSLERHRLKLNAIH